MTRKELLEALNAENQRLRRPSVTSRMLSDWIDEGILDHPEHRGRKRIWSDRHLYRCLDICRIRQDGSGRVAEIRVRLWLEGNDLSIDWVKESLADEFKRLRSRLLRRVTTTAERKEAKDLSKKRLEKIAGQLGANSQEASILICMETAVSLFNGDGDVGEAAKAFDEWLFSVKGFWRLPLFLFLLHFVRRCVDKGREILNNLQFAQQLMKDKEVINKLRLELKRCDIRALLSKYTIGMPTTLYGPGGG